MELSGGCFMDDSITPSTGLPSTGLTGALRALRGPYGLRLYGPLRALQAYKPSGDGEDPTRKFSKHAHVVKDHPAALTSRMEKNPGCSFPCYFVWLRFRSTHENQLQKSDAAQHRMLRAVVR